MSQKQKEKDISLELSRVLQPEKYREYQLPDNSFKLVKQAVARKIMGEDELIEQLLKAGLSAYTCNPLNIAVMGPASEGKTFSALNVIRLFPKEDVLTYAGASPKSFIHENGVLVDANLNPIQRQLDELNTEIGLKKNEKSKDRSSDYTLKTYELKKQREELLKGSKTLIDFENKILLLLDAPPKDLWDNLKTLLSHDKYYLEWKFVSTDKNIRTETVVFKGFPCLIVATARDESKLEIWPEIKTRVMVTNTNMDPEKYKKVFEFIAKHHMDPWKALQASEESKQEKEAKRIIAALRDILISERTRLRLFGEEHDPKEEDIVNIPFGHLIAQHYKFDKGSRQREIKQFLQLITMSALWNLKHRRFITLQGRDAGDVLGEEYRGKPTKMRFVTAEPEDYFAAERIFHSQGIAGFKLDFYRRVFYPCFLENKDGVSVTELRNFYKKITTKRITGEELNNVYLRELEKEGFIDDIGAKPEVHRQKHWYKPLIAVHMKTLDNSFEKPLFDAIGVDFRTVLTEEVYSELIKPLVNTYLCEDMYGTPCTDREEEVHDDHDHVASTANGSKPMDSSPSTPNGSEPTGIGHVNGFSGSVKTPENNCHAFPDMNNGSELSSTSAPIEQRSSKETGRTFANGFSSPDHPETENSEKQGQSNISTPSSDQGKENHYSGSTNGFLRRSVKSSDVVSKSKNPEVERLEKLSKLAKRYKSVEMLRLVIMAQFNVSEEQADADIQLLRSSGVVEY